MITNPRDLVIWAKALYEGRAMEGPCLGGLLSSSVPQDETGQHRYGLGVMIDRTELGLSFGHIGFFPGYKSAMAYFPEHRVAVAMQVNTDEVDEHELLQALAQVILRRIR